MSNKEQKKLSMAEALGKRMDEKETTVPQPIIPKKPEIPPVEDLTEDEIVEQALAEAKTETIMLNQETPQEEQSPSIKSLKPVETIPMQTEKVTSTNNPPAKEQPITPASSIDHLHATENSTPGLVELLAGIKAEKIIDDIDNTIEEKEREIYHVGEPTPGLDTLGGGIKIQHTFSAGIAGAEQEQDLNLRRLVEYIHSNEYSEAWVQLHISSISSFPRVLPTPTLWDVPSSVDMAALVYQVVLTSGFVENIWPYLRLIMGLSKDNVNWTAAVLTTCALFQALPLLPYVIKEGKDGS